MQGSQLRLRCPFHPQTNNIMNTDPMHVFQFCPRCGHNSFNPNHKHAKQCLSCHFQYFFNSSTAVIALIEDPQGKLLVTRRAYAPAQGSLDLPGGFVSPGESAESCLKREVLEETNILISSAHFLYSLPNVYLFSGIDIYTTDLVFSCQTKQVDNYQAADDVSEIHFLSARELNPDDFGLQSIQACVFKWKKEQGRV